MISDKFVILGAILNFAGSSRYIFNTIKGRTKPNRVTFFLWAFGAFLAFGAELHEHVGLQAVMTFVVGFSPFLIFLSSFVNKKSVWKLTIFDFVCAVLSLMGLGLWLHTRHGSYAIAFAIAGDAFAGLPTLKKAFLYPETESYFLFLMASCNAIITLLTIKTWNFATYAFPLYILIFCFTLFLLVRFKIGKRLEGVNA